MSNIKVSVAWDTPTTFAGEELRCTITFRNTAPDPSQARGQQQQQGHQKPHPAALSPAGGFRNDWSATPRSGRPSIALSDASKRPGHRQTVSLNAPTTRRLSSVPNTPTIVEHPNTRGSRTPKQSHKRSISIVSHGSVDSSKERDVQEQPTSLAGSPRKSPHARAASYHGTSAKGSPNPNGMLSPKLNGGVNSGLRSPRAPPLVRAATAGAAKGFAGDSSVKSPLLQANEEEDVDSLADDASQTTENASSAVGRSVSAPMRQRPFPSPLPYRDKPDNTPLQRVISPLGTEATPRSSLDLMSNYSEDTFASEYPHSGIFRFASQRHSRQVSQVPSVGSGTPASEHLMMGYVQLQGSFILDGSLVDLSPFDSVKQMGVIGGQGSGGVVGVGTPKRNSGILSSFGLSSLGSSFSGMLGGQEMSSMKEMKGIADKKSIPLISTPQSVLFVDLQLGPGQSKSFTYKHLLPKDLPPSHKGRAIKVEYQLTIGTQRAQTVGQKNNMRHVQIPFRVFPGITESGALCPHDLMEPHVLLRDQAVTKSTEDRKNHAKKGATNSSVIRSRNAFLAYAEQLLESSLNSSGDALLSPTEARRESRVLLSEEYDPAPAIAMRELIDQTVTRPMLVEPSSRSPNQFAIQRGGSPVAVISLVRPAYRLGETLTAVVDLTPSASHIFALHASLESEEFVDEAIALRSGASIRRATRRIHGHGSEATASCGRAVFRFTVPWSATPEFVTTGVRLEWRLRVEFVCSAYPKARKPPPPPPPPPSGKQQRRQQGLENSSGDDDDDVDIDDGNDEDGQEDILDFEGEELLEEITRDDRGVVFAALQEIHCENFEVGVPVRVFGADPASSTNTGTAATTTVASGHGVITRPDKEISI